MRNIVVAVSPIHLRYTMCSKLLLIVLIQLIIQLSYAQRKQHFFRKDYKYFDSTESFYKINAARKTWFDAKRICVSEGAKLLVPEDQNEVDILLSYLKETHKFDFVYIGISDLVAPGAYGTIDGRPILDVYHKWHPGEPNNHDGLEHCVQMYHDGTFNDRNCEDPLPFICKKTLSSLRWNEFCNMPFLDYSYNENMGKCYKFHSKPLNWTDAYLQCTAELSYLAVINSPDEANHFVQMSEKTIGDDLLGTVLLGFHNQFDEGWMTVRGESVEESGYNKWAPGLPAGDVRERCGSMLYNGLLSPIGCDKKGFFICEHDVVH